jgi:hypothetical protein
MINDFQASFSLGAQIPFAQRVFLITFDTRQFIVGYFKKDATAGMAFKTDGTDIFRSHRRFLFFMQGVGFFGLPFFNV